MTKYEPRFDMDHQRGMVGEDTHNDYIAGKHEVKTDYRVAETGNLYIETWQYNESGKWQSGINVTTSDFWVTGSNQGSGGIYIYTETLKELMRENDYREVHQPIYNANTNASIGRLVPLNDVLRKMGYVK